MIWQRPPVTESDTALPIDMGPTTTKKISLQFQKIPPEPTHTLLTAAVLSSPSDWCFAFTVIDIS